MPLSNNEWSQLKSVIVGDATGARIPFIDKSLRTVNYADKEHILDIQVGPYPKQVIEEANEDLANFVNFLMSEGIEVFRPDASCAPEYYNYCPRDSVLVVTDHVVEAPMPLRARADEAKALRHALNEVLSRHSERIEHNFISATRSDDLYNYNCVGNPDILALTEVEAAFDAANILRSNDDLFYLVSNSGNKKGAQVLRNFLGPRYRVWEIEGVYSYMHLDSTIALLREGLLLINPSRIKSIDQLPPPLRSWDVITCPEPVDIGHYPDYCNASKWINMNLFSVNPNLAVLEENQHPLRLELEKHGIDCAMLPMRHQRTLGGGFHCVTLDLERG